MFSHFFLLNWIGKVPWLVLIVKDLTVSTWKLISDDNETQKKSRRNVTSPDYVTIVYIPTSILNTWFCLLAAKFRRWCTPWIRPKFVYVQLPWHPTFWRSFRVHCSRFDFFYGYLLLVRSSRPHWSKISILSHTSDCH
jgi:hypothetical protein